MSDGGGRADGRLPLRQLLAISVYWLGINSVLGALNYQALPPLAVMFLGPLYGPTGFGLMLAIAVVAAALTQPTIGTISDYTVSRWGRRKPYIVVGSALDVVFLVGIALANDFLVLVALVLLVTFAGNFAQGPFQAYVPDLVPAKQVGLAGGLAGLMNIAGNTIGVGLVALSVFAGEELGIMLNHPYALAIIGVGLIEFTTALVTFATVDEGDNQPPARRGRSLIQIGLSAWSADVLAERSFLWLLATRLFLVAAPSVTLVTAPFFMRRTFAFDDPAATFWVFVAGAVVALAAATSVLPSGMMSERLGRKTVLYGAALAGAVGAVIVAAAPNIPVALVGAAFVGGGAGTYLAVEWALFSDIIPKHTPARYFGLAHVTRAIGSVPLPGLLSGMTITGVSLLLADEEAPEGPRVAVAASLVLFAAGAWCLRHVDPSRREAE